jgi:lipid II:glycine glycyltransferase (peptidoglycan interpeptide bridge formation enzyme)
MRSASIAHAGFRPALTPTDQAITATAPADHVLRLREATARDEQAWQSFLATMPYGDFLHDWGWGAVAHNDGEPQRRFILWEDGEPVGVAAAQVKRLFGGLSTWYVPHGPVLDFRHPRVRERLQALLGQLRDAGRDAGALAIRLEPRIERGSPEAAMFDGLGLRGPIGTSQVGQTQILLLDRDDAVMLANVEGPTRRKIRRAARDGVTVDVVRDPTDHASVSRLAQLVRETERRTGAHGRGIERIGLAWNELASRGRAAIVEAWFGRRLMAAGMAVIIGDRSFYLFSGSSREAPGQRKHFPSYAMQWEMIRTARRLGSRAHDLWGIEPPGAGPEHPWHGIGTFKRSFGGRSVVWAGSWDLVLRPNLYRAHRMWARTQRAMSRPRN